MRKKAVKRSWSKHNVPMEIWTEILARLPVRSLVRFRCVSRRWKTVIDDPDFCREHLVRFKNNRDKTHLLMVQDGALCFVRCSDTMKTSRRLGHLGRRDKNTGEWKSTATPGFDSIWGIEISVDGLVLLKCKAHGHHKLMLWNPSIRKCRLVQDSQGPEFEELGLGFDPLIKDYKVVRVSPRTPSVKIYTVGTASWRTVPAQEPSWLEAARWSRPVYFKGCLYTLSSTKLVFFDLSKEVFEYVDLPGYENSASWYFGDSLALVDGGSSLAILHFSAHGGSVWVLDDNADASTWSVRCTFSTRVPRFLYLKKNGDLLFDRMDTRSRLVSSYNLHTEEERVINYPKLTSCIFDYKESLVLLK